MSTSSNGGSDEPARILVVDDDPAIVKLLGVVLERAGYPCTTAESSEAALLCLDADLYRMLIVDKNLPGLDGIQLARIVHMLSPDLPILLITGYASSESVREAASIGIRDYIRKPIDTDDFRRVVSDTLGRSSPSFSRAQRRFGSTFPPGTLPVVIARLSSTARDLANGGEVTGLELLSGRSLLLIEPRAELRQQLAEILAVPECRVDAFGTVDEALAHVGQHGFDLLVGAPEALVSAQRLASQSPRAPLGSVAIMGRDDLDEAIEAVHLGARGLIAPPFVASRVFGELALVMKGLADEQLARTYTS